MFNSKKVKLLLPATMLYFWQYKAKKSMFFTVYLVDYQMT